MIEKEIIKKNGIIICDTSSIVYMSKISIISKYCQFKKILVSKYIYDELTCDINTNKIDEKCRYNYLFSYQYFYIYPQIRQDQTIPYSNNSKLTEADASLIFIYYNMKTQGILTDDGDLCKFCKRKKIPYINTPMAIFSLAMNKIISYDLFSEKLKEVYELGRYAPFVHDYMNRLIERYFYNV